MSHAKMNSPLLDLTSSSQPTISSLPPEKKTLVWEIGGGSTEFGTQIVYLDGPETRAETKQNKTITHN